MPNAVITTQNFNANGTQASYLSGIAIAMTTAGFDEIDSYTDGGNSFKVFSFDADPAKTYGKMILRVGFNSDTSMNIAGFSSWNAVNHTGTDASSASVSKTIALSDSVTVYVCNHPEIRGAILVRVGSTPLCFIGYLRPPAPVNGWWNENQSPLGFIERGAATNWNSSGLQPISSLSPSAITSSLSTATMSNNSTGNPSNNNIRMSGGVAMSVARSNGFNFLSFSSDLIGSATNGMDILATIQIVPGSEEYAIFDGGATNAANRIAVRVI